jgi:competence protein ComEC
LFLNDEGLALVRQARSKSGSEKSDVYWPIHPVTSALASLVGGLASGIAWNRYTGDFLVPVLFVVTVTTFRRLIRNGFGRKAAFFMVLVAIGMILGSVRHECVCRRVASDDIRHALDDDRPRLLEVRGVLIAREDRPPFSARDKPTSQLIVRTRFIAGQGGVWQSCRGDLLVETLAATADSVDVGCGVLVGGWIEPIPDALNPGERSPRAYWHGRGVLAHADLRSRGQLIADASIPGVSWRVWRERARRWACRKIREAVPGSRAGLAESLVLGIREGLSSSDREAFRDTSTIHLLAISGLHLQAVAMFVLILARRAGIRPGFSALCVVVVSCFYGAIVTGGASVLRSTVMAVALSTSTIRNRPGNIVHRILLAGLIVLIVNPGDLVDPGSQLSFLGTVAIIHASRLALRFDPFRDSGGISFQDRFAQWIDTPIRHDTRDQAFSRTSGIGLWFIAGLIWFGVIATRALMTSMFVSVIVWAVTAPLVAFHFDAVNPVAILANLPLIPLTGFALISGLIGLTCAPLGLTWLASTLLAACGLTMKLCVDSLDWSLRNGTGPWSFGPPWVAGVLGYYVLAWLCWLSTVPARISDHHAKQFWCIPVVFFGLWSVGTKAWIRQPPERLQVEMLAVDHGLAVLLRWPDGTNWLYDCGRMGRPSIGRNVVARALRHRGADRLDVLFVSHADSDHYNGIESMIQAGVQVDTLISTDRFFTTDQPDTQLLIESLRNRGLRFRSVSAGEILRQDHHGTARVSLPDFNSARSYSSDNAESLVIEIESHEIRMLLTGDLEGDGLRRFVDRSGAGQPFDIVTAPHHGGLGSNPSWFYAALRPRLVLSSQAKIRFGQTSGLRLRLDESCPDARLFTTADSGSIRMTWTPSGVHVTPFAPGLEPVRLSTVRSGSEGRGTGAPEMVLNP